MAFVFKPSRLLHQQIPRGAAAGKALEPAKLPSAVPAPASTGFTLPGAGASKPSAVSSFEAATRSLPSHEKAATKSGQFIDLGKDRLAVIQDAAKAAATTNNRVRPIDGEPNVTTLEHMAVDLQEVAKSPKSARALVKLGLQHMHQVAVSVSAAGLWSRGGGEIKALMPTNLAALLSPAENAEVRALAHIITAKSPADVMFIKRADVKAGQTLEDAAAGHVQVAQARYNELLKVAKADPRAVPYLALHIAQAALNSKASKSTVQLIINTSEQTHFSTPERQGVHEWLEGFKTNYARMTFHEEPAMNGRIVKAVGDYLLSDGVRLFGYQENVPAFDAATGAVMRELPKIGEGAGTMVPYLHSSGLAATLREKGIHSVFFSNIEVVNDTATLIGAHTVSGKPMSVLLVDQRPGYSGGVPLTVTKANGTQSMELHEESAMSPDVAKAKHQFFNTNSMIVPLGLEAPSTNAVAFERKVDPLSKRVILRVKWNAGDRTHSTTTAGIRGGNEPVSYENIKSVEDVLDNGSSQLSAVRALFARIAITKPAH